jgi:glycosyltransferase involved in cell wall biosynthesis
MRILIKYPSRGRPTWFFKTLDLYWRMISGRHDVAFLVAMDEDDVTMNNDLVKDYLKQITPPPCCSFSLEWFYAEHEGKVAAVNSGIAERDFDVVLVISDDIEPTEQAYDDIIASDITRKFPDLDGLIYYNEGRCGRWRIPIPIMGRKFFDRFGWIVHPDHIAWGDDFLTHLWKQTGKTKYINRLLFKHEWKKYIVPNKKGRRVDATSIRAKHKKTADKRTTKRLLAELEGKRP